MNVLACIDANAISLLLYKLLYYYNKFCLCRKFCNLRGPHCDNQLCLLHLTVREHESVREKKFSEYSVLFCSVNAPLLSIPQAYTDVSEEVTKITAQ